ncbi:C4-dicarboxylate ABC transporter substrate-binding protein [Caldalkalibacillus thermarum]|uniref:TRAP transporter substrate-binding protein n=1 Tax=Caldalkalibacillus thermarum TaxID=296745 RepID=UPI001997ACC1|nr:DctP family TRAP transporter solute-binding subunit [Caldalkalibacillus thermarum]GGK34456.1 C4-dicarboxylate ABC transporter substrate-binding protein [Caldalkalibacillus thermarum]
MKRWTVLMLFLALCSVLAACGGETTSGETGSEEAQNEVYEIRVAHLVNEEQSTHVALLDFKERVEERTDGRVQIKIYPSGSLYPSDREAIEAVQMGNLEMTIPAVAPLAGFNSKFMVFDLPFLFETKEAAYRALDGELGQTLLEDLRNDGLRGLVFAENGFRHITNNRGPIEEPSDLEGLKFRTMENPVHTDTFRALGANASPFSFGELYTALQQGTYDAMESPVSLIYTSKFYEVQDYLTLSGHFYAATIMLMNEDYFNSLPEDIQQILQEEAETYRGEQRQLADQQDNEWLQTLKDEGMKVNELTVEQKQAFIEATKSVYDAYADEIGADLIEMARQANQ